MLNQQILKLQGEIKDASQGLNVIESRCVVTNPNGEGPRTSIQGGTFAGHDFVSSKPNSEIQVGFNRYHNTTPLVPNSPVSITSKGADKDATGCLQGKSLYVALISKNLRRLGNTAPFANKSQRESQFNRSIRTQKDALRLRKPDSMNYHDVDISYKEPYTFHFDDQVNRIDQVESNKELAYEYKNRLEVGDYSSFRVDKMTKVDISKFEERDAVSFYMPLARQMKAEKFKMSLPEYTKKLREFKSGKFEHAIFLSKQ